MGKENVQTDGSYKTEWSSQPQQGHNPPCPHFSKETQSLRSDITEMLKKQFPIKRVSSQASSYSQKDGGHRPIINLKEVKQIHPTPSFQDGRDTHAKRPLETRGLHGKDRLERHLLVTVHVPVYIFILNKAH